VIFPGWLDGMLISGSARCILASRGEEISSPTFLQKESGNHG